MRTTCRQRKLIIILCMMILSLSSMVYASSSSAADPPPCTGAGCNGQNPQTLKSVSGYSCSNPPSGYSAVDVETATAPAGGSIITSVLRYSSWCQAYWAYGVYGPLNGQTQWSFDVQVTTTASNKPTVYHALITNSLGVTSGYTSMYVGPADACVEYLGPSPYYRVCTRQVRLEFVQAGSLGKVGTNCNNPTSPAPNNWKFRVVGLNPASNNRIDRLEDGAGGLWLNPTIYGCPSPYRWPVVTESIIINGSYGGMYMYVAAWPDTNTPGALPVSGRIYKATVLRSLGGTVYPTYQR